MTNIDAMQDLCLIAITDGESLPVRAIAQLPPWRAVMLGRVAEKAGIAIEGGTLEQLVSEARRVGGEGKLTWPPTETTHCRACGGTGEFDSGEESYTCGVCGGVGEHPTDLVYGVTGTAEIPPVHYPERPEDGPREGDRVRLTYGDGSTVEGTWRAVLELDDGTLHTHTRGQVRRDVLVRYPA